MVCSSRNRLGGMVVVMCDVFGRSGRRRERGERRGGGGGEGIMYPFGFRQNGLFFFRRLMLSTLANPVRRLPSSSLSLSLSSFFVVVACDGRMCRATSRCS